MNSVDQNSAFRSMSQALVPGKDMIDGRSEADRLEFLCGFARLISFYDNTNTLRGNWSPFLLKDPVFLVAHISKTKTERFYSPYYNACLRLQKSLAQQPVRYNHADAIAFNQVFDQLTLVFMQIERWTHYMQLSDESYDLKQYLVLQVKERFGALFWALQSLREALFISSVLPDIERVYYYLFDKYDELTWKISRDKVPYWQLLQMKGPRIDDETVAGIEWPDARSLQKAENAIREKGYYHYNGFWENPALIRESAKPLLYGEIARDCFAALQGLGDELFNFTYTIVHNAATELQKINKKRSGYPDTMLLRAFLDLLTVHQDQLNGLAEKHLRFYYKDILKQSEKPAQADTALIYATLSANTDAYVLPAGTGFNGGVDANKNPIVFSTTQDVCLNPAVIATAYTLNVYQSAATSPLLSYYLQNIPAPTQPQTNEAGALQSWPTFGGTPPTGLNPVSTSLAFASPMLLLREGQRTIEFSMTCTGTITQNMLTAANYYLGTGTAWQELIVNTGTEPNVTQSSILVNNSTIVTTTSTSGSTSSINLRIDLPVTQSPIVPFTANPDGYSSPWPMFKITFNGMDDPANPPLITGITITTTVTGMSGTLQLYNDNGAVSTKNPYQPFGPLPLLNSSFAIGSDEIFSKPVTSVYLTLKWNNLPAAFDVYYTAYNNYLSKYPYTSGTAASSTAATSSPASQITGTGSIDTSIALPPGKPRSKLAQFFITIFNFILRPFKKRSGKTRRSGKKRNEILADTAVLLRDIAATPCTDMFNNICFTANFSVLQQSAWLPVVPVQYGNISVNTADNTIRSSAYTPGSACCTPPLLSVPTIAWPGINLFGTTDPCNLVDTSFYEITPPVSPSGNSCIITPDPGIQNAPLSYTGSGNAGFIKLNLATPVVGFGSSIYANVVNWVAIQNALAIKGQTGYVTQDVPNPPFSPKLSSLTVHYTASQTYSLLPGNTTYPLQCFMYTPFAILPVYDNSANPVINSNSTTGALCGVKNNPTASAGLPLFPALTYQGILYLGPAKPGYPQHT